MKILFIVFMSLLCSCNKASPSSEVKPPSNTEKWETITVGQLVELSVPPYTEIEEKRPIQDYVIVSFSNEGGELILTAYIGNHPNFPSQNFVLTTENIEVQNYLTQVAVANHDLIGVKEVLIDFGEDQFWPRYIHFGIMQGTPKQINLVEKIIQSARFVPNETTLWRSDYFPAERD